MIGPQRPPRAVAHIMIYVSMQLHKRNNASEQSKIVVLTIVAALNGNNV